MTEASAPGKLILVGEYAVLYGAPALSTSVDVRAFAQVSAIEGRESILFDSAGGQAHFFLTDPEAGLQWTGESPGAGGSIVEAVIDTCLRDWPALADQPSFRISLNSDAFFDRATTKWKKLGVGSSAAVLVALVGALARELGLEVTAERLLDTCCEAHRKFQQDRGSGIDVATSAHGGVVLGKPGDEQSAMVFSSHPWVPDLHALPIWTGQSASTTDLIARCEIFRRQKRTIFDRHLSRLTLHAEQATASWVDKSVVNALSAISAYDDALMAFDEEAQIGISTDTHRKIRRIVEQHGAVYKISGAGGGDFGIALTDSAESLQIIRETCEESGYRPFDFSFAVPGVTIV